MSKKKKQLSEVIDFQEYLTREIKNPEFKKYYDKYSKQLEIAYQILQLRKQKRMSQTELAKKLGTKQSNIARMETGQQNFTTDMLQKIATALKKNLRIEFIK